MSICIKIYNRNIHMFINELFVEHYRMFGQSNNFLKVILGKLIVTLSEYLWIVIGLTILFNVVYVFELYFFQ